MRPSRKELGRHCYADPNTCIDTTRDRQVQSRNRDGWERWLVDIAPESMGQETAADLDVRFCTVDEKTIALLDGGPSALPAFAKTLNGERRDVFFVRLGNRTDELAGPALLEYRSTRWVH